MAAESKSLSAETTIRRLRPEDAAAVSRIMEESPEAARWSKESYEASGGWGGVLALVSETRGELGGVLIGRQVADEGEVLNLAVREEKRRKGEGGALLEAALTELKAGGVTHVYLEVRESNSVAIAFYGKHNFSKTGRRKSYYRDPEEAAVLLERKLTG
jgi:[ribosomal protein S18]-alanine N-acetyltransferase